MKNLELNQMELVHGGEMDPCTADLIGLGLTFVGAFFVTTPLGAAVFAAGFIWGSATLDC
jgi:hypothetical protein